MEKIKVMVVEDQLIYRKGISMLLSDIDELELMPDAANGKEFLELIKTAMPDVVLMDIHMPVMDGIEATKTAAELYPGIKILTLSMHGEEEYLKSADEDELKKAILVVNGGKNYFSDDLMPLLTGTLAKKKRIRSDLEEIINSLTKRELEILGHICKGFTSKDIAEVCFISPRTAAGHRTNLLEKTGCKNTAELVAFGIQNNLLGQGIK